LASWENPQAAKSEPDNPFLPIKSAEDGLYILKVIDYISSTGLWYMSSCHVISNLNFERAEFWLWIRFPISGYQARFNCSVSYMVGCSDPFVLSLALTLLNDLRVL
jgi:hypothetical protein